MPGRNDSVWGAFAMGAIVGWLAFFALSALPSSKISIYDKAKEQCERSLPRDQKCIIVGVPEEKK